VRRDELPELETGRPRAEARQQLALGAVDAHARSDIGHVLVDGHAAPDLADVEAPRRAALQIESRGPVHVGPLRLVPAVGIEHLHAMILAIGDVHPAVRVAADVVRNVELARVGARLAPRGQQRAVRRVLVHARIAVPVGDVQIAARRQRGVRATVKRLAAHVRRWLARDAQGQQHLAVQRAVPHGVIAVVAEPQRVVGRHVHAVGPAKHAFAPRAEKIAVAVEHAHRVRAPVERVHAVVAVDADRRDIGVELEPGRQRCPAVDDFVGVLTRAENHRHVTRPRNSRMAAVVSRGFSTWT
jgi:hypothetical protein